MEVGNTNRDKFMTQYWRYYLLLEKEFMSTLDYAEFHQDNQTTFSNRYAMLIHSIGAELDSFFKVYCGFNPDSKTTITDYAEQILSSWPEIRDQRVEITGKQAYLQPFAGWEKGRAKQSLFWWDSYDCLKHSRAENANRASQICTANILAALYMLEMKELSIICNGNAPDLPDEQSALFDLEDWNYRFLPCGDGYAYVDGYLCMVDTRRVRWADP